MNSLSSQLALKAFFRGDRGVKYLAAIVVAGMVGGCATVGPRTPEEAVRARAQERWDVLVKGELVKGYQYFSPGSRIGFSEEDFVGSIRRGFWKSAKVQDVTCPVAESCEVEVAVEYEFKGLRNTTPVRETWVRDGREWWYLRK